MVYPRANGSRSLAKFVAFCALNLCLLHGADAVAEGTCTMVVSPGDDAAGIRIYTDNSCVGGGVGCINNDCRFCKVRLTPQSTNFVDCPPIGNTNEIITPVTTAPPAVTPCPPTAPPTTAPPTTAPPTTAPPTTAPPTTAPPTTAPPTTAPPTTAPPTTAPPTTAPPTTAPPTTAPVTTAPPTTAPPTTAPPTTAPPTTAPPTTKPPTAAPVTTAPLPTAIGGTTSIEDCQASQGDQAVGIQSVSDASCVNGGLGCYDGHCRYCKYGETSKSGHLMTCSSLGANFPAFVSKTVAPVAPGTTCGVAEGDYAVGVTAIVDANCASGGLGCYNDHCRFCKYRSTPQSAPYGDCSLYSEGSTLSIPTPATAAPVPATPAPEFVIIINPAPVPATPAPAVTAAPIPAATPCPPTATPATAKPSDVVVTPAPTAAPVTAAPLDVVVTPAPTTKVACPVPISPGDAANGMYSFSDSSCKTGGLGCSPDGTCRMCRARDAPLAMHLNTCASYGVTTGSGLDITPQSVVPVTATPATATPATATPATATPATATPATATPIETAAPAPVASLCNLTVSPGDAANGINVMTDMSCVTGGTGCFEKVCRYCKVRDTPLSAHLNSCSGSTTAPVTATPGVAPTPDVTPTPPAVTPTPPVATSYPPSIGECLQTIDPGNAAAGISLYTDVNCSRGGTGCIDTVCRYCKTRDTPQSGHLPVCPSVVITPTPATPSPAYGDTVSPYDSTPSAYDSTPSAYDSTPSAYDSTPSAYDSTPSAYDFTTPAYDTPTAGPYSGLTPTPSPPASSKMCTQEVSVGDYNAGLNLVTDASCSEGGMGCVDNVCRFCKRSPEVQSPYPLCSSPDSEDPVLITPQTPATYAPAFATPSPATDSPTSTDGIPPQVGDTAPDLGSVPVTDATPTPVTDPVTPVQDPATSVPDPVASVPDPILAPEPTAVSDPVLTVPDPIDDTPIPDSTADTPIPSPVVVSVRMAAKSESSLPLEFSKIMKDGAMKWVVGAAACVGVGAVVAMLALATKRVVRALGSSPSDEENDDEEEDVEAPSEEATNMTSEDSVIMTQM